LQFRYRGSRRKSAVAQLSTLGGITRTVKPTRKTPMMIGFLMLVGLFVVGLAYRSITHHYYPVLEPSASSVTARISTTTLFITAAIFYGLVIPGLLLARRSWIDVLVFGAVLFIFCATINYLLPPVGAVLFVGFHCVWIFVWIRSAWRRPQQSDHDHDHAA
jgi:TRAP-type C4-dicarboxylate transport system permease large subunit